MQLFSGLDYLRIDIANCYGLDKEDWFTRINWVKSNEGKLEELIPEASDKLLMTKAVYAYRDAQAGIETGHIMYLDATASGIQLMACLSGCIESARKVNLVNTGRREDVYTYVVEGMNKILPEKLWVTRNDTKKPLMQHFYNKSSMAEFFNEMQEKAFYEVIQQGFEGPELTKEFLNECWNPEALEHSWVMFDGHVVICKVKEMVDARISVDELGTSFTYRFEANNPSFIRSSLAPNVIHAIDSYVAREMVRRAKKQGFQLTHIHDAFGFSPKYGNKVRKNYINILAEIAESNLLADIMSQITGKEVIIDKSNELANLIRESDYALS